MKFNVNGDILNVSEVIELATSTATSFQAELSAALSEGVKRIVLDLSQTTFVDCGGLGALVTLQKKASHTTVRLLNPPAPLQRLMSLMQMDEVFPFDTSEAMRLGQPHAA